jgi:hypothetical protein
MREVERVWDNPFGDGKAAAKIADVVEEALDPARRWDGPEILDVSGGDGMAVPSQEQPA